MRASRALNPQQQYVSYLSYSRAVSTYLLNRMAANRFVHITQLPVSTAPSGIALPRSPGCSSAITVSATAHKRKRTDSYRTQRYRDNHVHFVQTLTGDGVGNQRSSCSDS